MMKIVITGGSRGFGKALLNFFLAQGHQCLIIARQAIDTSSYIPAVQERIQCYKADLSVDSDVDALCQTLIKFNPDVLINNAAILGPVGLSWQQSADDWQQTFQVNTHAPIRLSQTVIPAMIANGFGRIINLSGGGAANCRPYYNAYASSKAALSKFTETIAAELKESGVTVNSIAPGMMATDMLEHCQQHAQNLNQHQELLKIQTCLNSPNFSKPIALCNFLIGDTAGHISGKLISAPWDDWLSLKALSAEQLAGDLYTLRRVTVQSTMI